MDIIKKKQFRLQPGEVPAEALRRASIQTSETESNSYPYAFDASNTEKSQNPSAGIGTVKGSTAEKSHRWKDLDLNFVAHPVSKDINRRYDSEAVKRSIRNLVYMKDTDVPFHPEIGSDVFDLLFEPVSDITATAMQTIIKNIIVNYEPRAQVNRVRVQTEPDANSYSVLVEFTVVNTGSPERLSFRLNRIR